MSFDQVGEIKKSLPRGKGLRALMIEEKGSCQHNIFKKIVRDFVWFERHTVGFHVGNGDFFLPSTTRENSAPSHV